MKQLIYDSTKGIVKGFDPQLYKTLKADVPENIYYILKNLQVSYGLSLPDFLYEQLTIFLTPDKEYKEGDRVKIDICKAIDKEVRENKCEFNKLLLFAIDPMYYYDFPSVFQYQSFLFILKAAIVNKKNSHFYLYLRKKFLETFLVVDDKQIKEADINDIRKDNICLAMYYVFLNDKEEKEINVEVTKEEELKIPAPILKILNKIMTGTENPTTNACNITMTAKTKPDTYADFKWGTNSSTVPKKQILIKTSKQKKKVT